LPFKGFSAFAGALALGLMMIPLILRTTEEVVLLVPNGYREAALALGIARWKTILHIVMKTASKGIITGILLALARVAMKRRQPLRLATFLEPDRLNPSRRCHCRFLVMPFHLMKTGTARPGPALWYC
jgi:hypothetical protein